MLDKIVLLELLNKIMFNRKSYFQKMVYNLKRAKNMFLENVSIVEMDGYMQEIHHKLSYKNEAQIKKE